MSVGPQGDFTFDTEFQSAITLTARGQTPGWATDQLAYVFPRLVANGLTVEHLKHANGTYQLFVDGFTFGRLEYVLPLPDCSRFGTLHIGIGWKDNNVYLMLNGHPVRADRFPSLPSPVRPKHFQRPEIGHCIYCSDVVPLDQLSREHVLPKGLGGMKDAKGKLMAIARASCAACALITKGFETDCIEYMFNTLRVHSGAPLSHGGTAPTRAEVKIGDLNSTVIGSREIEKLFMPGVFLKFPRPSLYGDTSAPILSTVPLSGDPSAQVVPIMRPHAPDEDDGEVTVGYWVNQLPYRRMLAKIAHAYAHYELWPVENERFEPLLQGFIRGLDPSFPPQGFALVGSSSVPLVGSERHLLAMSQLAANGERFLTVKIRLFAQYPESPTYDVIVGRLIS